MDRIFLDANVLFSEAYRANSGLLSLWRLRNARLCSSHYAVEEARINLDQAEQKERLTRLSSSLELFEAEPQELPDRMVLPEKDTPIMLAAMAARATHLLTGDLRHFGAYFGKTIGGILILPPSDYLKLHGRSR
jgi:hypothetical protein